MLPSTLCSFREQFSQSLSELTSGSTCLSVSICVCLSDEDRWDGVPFPSPSLQSFQGYLNEVSIGEMHVPSFFGSHILWVNISQFSFSGISYYFHVVITVLKITNIFNIFSWRNPSNIVNVKEMHKSAAYSHGYQIIENKISFLNIIIAKR